MLKVHIGLLSRKHLALVATPGSHLLIDAKVPENDDSADGIWRAFRADCMRLRDNDYGTPLGYYR